MLFIIVCCSSNIKYFNLLKKKKNRLTNAEAEGEKTILNKLSSTATDFICLTNKPSETTYQIDELALKSAKRRADDSSDDECSSLDNEEGDYNPFSMHSDNHREEVNMQGGFIEDDDDMSDLANEASALRQEQISAVQAGMSNFRKSKKKMLKTASKNIKHKRR